MTNDPRFGRWISGTIALFIVAGVVGFVWLPSMQPGGTADLWATICRAVGLPVGPAQASVRGEGQPASDVAWTTATRALMARGDAARGAALATACNNCHGVNGVSSDAAFPNLAGHSVNAIYKQLEDFKSGKREHGSDGRVREHACRRRTSSTWRRTLRRCQTPSQCRRLLRLIPPRAI